MTGICCFLLLISITNIHQFRERILQFLFCVFGCPMQFSKQREQLFFCLYDFFLSLLDCGCDFVERDLLLFLKSIYVTRDVQVVVVLFNFVQSSYIAVFVDRFPVFVSIYDLSHVSIGQVILILGFFEFV